MVSELEQAMPELAQVHRLRFHLAMDEEDHITAIEALQRYFDYSHGKIGAKFIIPGHNTLHFKIRPDTKTQGFIYHASVSIGLLQSEVADFGRSSLLGIWNIGKNAT